MQSRGKRYFCWRAGACGQCRTRHFYSGFVQLCEICILKCLGNSKSNCLSNVLLKIAIGNTTKCFGVYRAHQRFLNPQSAHGDALSLACTNPSGDVNQLGATGSPKAPHSLCNLMVCPSASQETIVALVFLLIRDVVAELCKCLRQQWKCSGDLRMGPVLRSTGSLYRVHSLATQASR